MIIITPIIMVLYVKDFFNFKKKDSKNRFILRWKDHQAYLKDKTSTTGFDRHYIYHTAWAARVLKNVNPKKHVDISSSLYFAAIVSAFIPIQYYDFRIPHLKLTGIDVSSANLLELPFKDNSIRSLSCMHVIEHIGLGRYGDPIDPDGDLKAIAELKRVLKKGGDLLMVVPLGKPRIVFNAHRIYSYEQIIEYFKDLSLEEFSLIPDDYRDGHIIKNAPKEMVDSQTYACGCFWFHKNKSG